jgi:sterol desaturase/sphingolipid hydroxylase (fatty acid hydroxylase superfamily)
MDRRGYLSLLGLNLALAGVMLTLPWVGTLIGDPARHARGSSAAIWALTYARSAVFGIAGIGTLLFLLTFVEAMGIRFFARRRGWRITRNVAWQICAHASIGWVLAAVLTLLSLVVWLNLSNFGLSGWMERSGPTGDYVMAAVPAVGFFAGMFVFELLVYVGMRRCRFANAPRADRQA